MNPNSNKKKDEERDEVILNDQHSDGVHFNKDVLKAKEAEGEHAEKRKERDNDLKDASEAEGITQREKKNKRDS
ncbi:hypothetical protein RM545_17235 [Zunongwangia sp. F260]|uniref:Uncharacterized protein n=1 Tax=Autumnicola lenta TaxID=3075593 RepID=A0ABU3CPZ9_9FLAO|nr:hypothetical protein [Zunongwangia sp. F260]MDT0648434.1 hypothetical protein [Zunongwangia sp. F260]